MLWKLTFVPFQSKKSSRWRCTISAPLTMVCTIANWTIRISWSSSSTSWVSDQYDLLIPGLLHTYLFSEGGIPPSFSENITFNYSGESILDSRAGMIHPNAQMSIPSATMTY